MVNGSKLASILAWNDISQRKREFLIKFVGGKTTYVFHKSTHREGAHWVFIIGDIQIPAIL